MRAISGRGNGPISALIHALRRDLGVEADVLDYAEHALGAGEEAFRVGGAVHRVGEEHAGEEQNFGDEEQPHAEVRGVLLLFQRFPGLGRRRASGGAPVDVGSSSPRRSTCWAAEKHSTSPSSTYRIAGATTPKGRVYWKRISIAGLPVGVRQTRVRARSGGGTTAAGR